MEKNPILNDVRDAQRLRRLPPNAICIFCGEQDPRTLVVHHGVGRANDEKLTLVVCRNCHAKHHDEFAKAGVALERDPSQPWLVTQHAILIALSVLFQALAAACRGWAQQLYADIQMLDTSLPQWRSLPAATI